MFTNNVGNSRKECLNMTMIVEICTEPERVATY